MDDETTLEVGFAVNVDQLTAAGSVFDDVFGGVATMSASVGSDITASMTSAADSFSAIGVSAAQIGVGVEEGVAGAIESLDTLPSAGEEASSSLSESISQAGIGFDMLQEAVSTLAGSVNEAVSQINSQIDSIGPNAEEAASVSESSFEGFDLGGMVTSVGMGIFSLQAMGNMAAQTAQSLLGPAEAAENTQASFTNLLGSTGAANNELGKLNTLAAATQFKTQDIDNAAASLIAFKTPAQNIVPDLTAVGDALTAVGKGTPAEMQGVVNVLGKISTQGKLTQGDITQLGAHGIDAMSAIEKGSGLSATALSNMISKGTLPAGKAIDDLTKGIEKNPMYSGGMAKQAGTLSGQMSTLSSDFDQVMAAALAPALPGLEKTFGQLATTLTSPSFKNFAVTMGKDIAGGITDVVTGIGHLVDAGKDVVTFFTNNQTAMDGLKAGLVGVGAVAVTVFGLWAIAMAPVALEAIVTMAPFLALGVGVGLVVFGIIEAVNHWQQIQEAVGGAVKASLGAVGSFFGSVGHDIQGVFGAIGGAAENVGKGIEGAFKGGVNGVIEGLNWLINAVDSFHVSVPPLVVAGVTVFGGVDLGLPPIPDIPLLAKGGIIGAGQYGIAGETGQPELIYGGSSGVSVLGASQSAALLNSGNSRNDSSGGEIHVHVHNHNYIDGKKMSDNIMTHTVKTIRGQGGMLASI